MKKFILIALAVFLLSVSQGEAAQNCNSDISFGSEGWIFRDKTDFQENFIIDQELEKLLQDFNRALQSQNIDLVISLLPTRGMEHAPYVHNPNYDSEKAQKNYLKTAEQLKELGLNVAYTNNFQNHPNYFYKTDHHWSAKGAKAMAERVVSVIKELPIHKDLEKIEFQTSIDDKIQFEGSYLKLIVADCLAHHINSEQVQTYKTFPVSNDNLFEEVSEPEITLIGTSNSDNNAAKANFEGFLKEALSADIVNHSISGGGHDSAILQYLASDNFKKNKPKIIIWEFPIYQNFRDKNFYKQAIANVYGDCGERYIFQQTLKIVNNKIEMILPKSAQNTNNYIFMHVPNFDQQKMRVVLTYDDDSRIPFDFKRSKYYEPDGKFFLLLEQGKKPVKIEALLPEAEFDQATIKICSNPKKLTGVN